MAQQFDIAKFNVDEHNHYSACASDLGWDFGAKLAIVMGGTPYEFELTKTVRDRDNDITHWEFQPVYCAAPADGVMLTIFND